MHATTRPDGSLTTSAEQSIAGADAKRDSSVEDAIDDALGMTFPASDPPAWGCLARRQSQTDRP